MQATAACGGRKLSRLCLLVNYEWPRPLNHLNSIEGDDQWNALELRNKTEIAFINKLYKPSKLS